MVAAVAAVAAVEGTAAEGSPAAVPGVPAIYVNYSADCTFTISVDGGISITSATPPGPTLPPGTYQLLISMPNPSAGYAPCTTPAFALTGPGVNSHTLFPGAALSAEQMATLQPSSTYVADDENAPDATRKVFTTASSGSNSVLLGPTPGSTPGTTQATSVQPDLVGSAILPYRGKLVATVSAAGKTTLKLGARNVRSLKAGRYDIRVDDAAARAGFFLRHGARKPLTVTSRAFVGTRTRRVTFTAGTWTFFSGVAKPTRFSVRPA